MRKRKTKDENSYAILFLFIKKNSTNFSSPQVLPPKCIGAGFHEIKAENK